MRIDFERSGGFAGLRLTYRADADDLAPQLAEELAALVESSGFFDIQQSEVEPAPAGPPDVFLYRLSLSQGGREKTLSFNDVTAPATLRPLLERLQKLALEKKRISGRHS